MKQTRHRLLQAALGASLGVLVVHSACATTFSFNFDSDPIMSGLFTAYSSGDNGTLGALAGSWISTNGSPLQAGAPDPSANGYWAITQTTPTNTYSGHGMKSALVINEIDPGYAEAGFTFACDVRVGGGSTVPADGFAVSFARTGDASVSTASEKGTSTGLAVCFLAYNGDSATGLRGLQINVDSVAVTNVALTNLNGACDDPTSLQTGPTDTTGTLYASNLVAGLCWQPVRIQVDPAGFLSVSFKGVTLLTNFALPSALGAGNFVISGRTGGLWQEEDIDNLSIVTTPATTPVVGPVAATANSWSFRIYDSGTATPATNSITVTVDGVAVVPTSITQSGNIGLGDGTGVTTVSYRSGTRLFISNTQHTNVVQFTGTGFSGSVNKSLVFSVPVVKGPLDRIAGYPALFYGISAYSTNQSGRTGAPGDYAIDIGNVNSSTNSVYCLDASFASALNAACAQDTVTISMWMKRRSVPTQGGTSDIWLYSLNEGQRRGLNLHCPYYSGEAVYYDTGGYSGPAYRISGTVTNGFGTFDGTTNWWFSWRHLVMVKNGGAKQLWIDGQLFLSQDSGAAPMRTDMAGAYLGSAATTAPAPSLSIDGWIDDVAFYSAALSGADVTNLFNGAAPNQIAGASSNLFAWWDFNDVPTVSVAKRGNNAVVTFTQVLQAATNASGPFIDLPNATSPYTNDLSAPVMFFRTHK